MARQSFKRRKFCRFTAEKIQQRQLATAVKRARFLALLPYTDQHK